MSQLTKIKIPKVAVDGLFCFKIHRGGYVQTEKAIKVILHKQMFEGVQIPNGLEIWIPIGDAFVDKEFAAQPEVKIRGWKVNEFIRMLYMDSLRNVTSSRNSPSV